mgnify:FL=1
MPEETLQLNLPGILRKIKESVETVFGPLSEDFKNEHTENPRTGDLMWSYQKRGMRWELVINITNIFLDKMTTQGGKANA